jgi:hypothetical protein
MNRVPASIELACLFPPDLGLKGACTTIADLPSRYRWPAYPSKWLAVRTIVKANLERDIAHGQGNRAKLRIANRQFTTA